MDVNEFRDFVLFLLRKSQSGGNPSPDQFNLAMERGYVASIMGLVGNTKEYMPGNPVPRVTHELTQRIIDDLSFLKVDVKMNVDSEGKMNVPNGSSITDFNNQTPADYMYLSSLRYDYIYKDRDNALQVKTVPIDVLRDSELGNALSSDIVNPTLRHPAASIQNEYMNIYPKEIKSVHLTYLKQPTIPNWAYTTVNNRPVYDSANSVDLEAPQQMINDIVLKTLTFLGVSARELGVINVSEQLQQKGL